MIVKRAADELEALFRDHHHRVISTAYRITGSLADAEDVAQSVFLRLARGEVDLSGVQNMGAYLHRTAVNAALDLLRARRDSHPPANGPCASRTSRASCPGRGRTSHSRFRGLRSRRVVRRTYSFLKQWQGRPSKSCCAAIMKVWHPPLNFYDSDPIRKPRRTAEGGTL